MKVLYLTGHGNGGSNVSLKNSILGLLKMDVEVLVVVPDYATKRYYDQFNINATILDFEADYWPFLNNLLDFIKFIPRLFTKVVKNAIAIRRFLIIVNKYSPDIIHTNISTIQLGYKVAQKCKIKHVWHIREYNTKDFGYIPMPSIKSLKRMLSTSYTISISKDLRCFYNLVPQKCHVIYNGIMAITDIPPQYDKQNYFLYVGGISQGKGVDKLICTFIDFLKIRPDACLRIVGEGQPDIVNNLKQIIKDNHCHGNISFLGRREDVYELMSRAKALVVPSVSEGFGRITAEAMFCHCPVIGYNNAGTKEQFDNGVSLTNNEIGYRYNNDKELIHALLMLSDVNNNQDELTERAYKTACELYTIDVNVNSIYKLYNEILKTDIL